MRYYTGQRHTLPASHQPHRRPGHIVGRPPGGPRVRVTACMTVWAGEVGPALCFADESTGAAVNDQCRVDGGRPDPEALEAEALRRVAAAEFMADADQSIDEIRGCGKC